MNVGTLTAFLNLDRSGFSRGIQETHRQTKAVERSMNGLRGAVVNVGAALAAAFTFQAAISGVRSVITAASALEETLNKFNVVFRGLEGQAEAWTKTLAEDFNMSERAARFFLSSVQDMLVPMGMSRLEAGRLSSQIVQLSADIGSFNDQPTAVVMRDIQAALAGQYEGMRKYGVMLNATKIQQAILTSGLADSKDAITETQKALMTYRLIMEGSADAVGDVARSQGTYAYVVRRLQANIEDLQGVIGKQLLPVLSDMLAQTNQWIKDNDKLLRQKIPEHVERVAAGIEAMVVGLGKMHQVYAALPDGVVGAAGIGIVGRLIGGGKFGALAATLYLLNRQLDQLGMGLGDIADSGARAGTAGRNIWDVLTGRRHWNTGELREDLASAANSWNMITGSRSLGLVDKALTTTRGGFNMVARAQAEMGWQATRTGQKTETAAGVVNEAVASMIASLRFQAETLGMTTKEVKLYELSLEGASEAQLAEASNILKTIALYERQVQVKKDAAIAAAEFAREQEREAEALALAHETLRIAALAPDEREVERIQQYYQHLNAVARQLAMIGEISEEAADQFQLAFGERMTEELEKLEQQGTSTMERLQQAIEGWGRSSTDAIVDFAMGGKASFKDMINSMIADLLRMIIYQQTIGPLFAGIGSVVGGGTFGAGVAAFGGGRARGGPVSAGSFYEVNEQGPELLTVGSKQYLMMGQQPGKVTPAAKEDSQAGPAKNIVQNTFNIQAWDVDAFEQHRDRIIGVVSSAMDDNHPMRRGR